MCNKYSSLVLHPDKFCLISVSVQETKDVEQRGDFFMQTDGRNTWLPWWQFSWLCVQIRQDSRSIQTLISLYINLLYWMNNPSVTFEIVTCYWHITCINCFLNPRCRHGFVYCRCMASHANRNKMVHTAKESTSIWGGCLCRNNCPTEFSSAVLKGRWSVLWIDA